MRASGSIQLQDRTRPVRQPGRRVGGAWPRRSAGSLVWASFRWCRPHPRGSGHTHLPSPLLVSGCVMPCPVHQQAACPPSAEGPIPQHDSTPGRRLVARNRNQAQTVSVHSDTELNTPTQGPQDARHCSGHVLRGANPRAQHASVKQTLEQVLEHAGRGGRATPRPCCQVVTPALLGPGVGLVTKPTAECPPEPLWVGAGRGQCGTRRESPAPPWACPGSAHRATQLAAPGTTRPGDSEKEREPESHTQLREGLPHAHLPMPGSDHCRGPALPLPQGLVPTPLALPQATGG